MRYAWVFVYLGSASCLFPSLDEYGACANGACTGPGSGGDAAGGSGATAAGGAGGSGASAGAGGSAAPCAPPLGRGPEGVLATPMPQGDPFCIDSTEVSFAHYIELVYQLDDMPDAEFEGYRHADCDETLLVKSTASFQADEMGEKTVAWIVVDRGDLHERPAIEANWCEAFAYCKWAGKSLCGDVRGGPADVQDPLPLHQWVAACSANDLTNNKYGYGPRYVAGTCEAYEEPRASAECNYLDDLRDAAPNGCEGGYPGLYNMSGNTFEWTDNCDADGCYPLGGACQSGMYSSCTDYQLPATPRSKKVVTIGFRCCWSPEGS